MSLDQLKQVSKSRSVPIDLLLEGALARLESYERKDAPKKLCGTKRNLKRRQTHGAQIPFNPEQPMKGEKE